ncbi:guanylate kinase [Fulvitalea axinellae]|uniref:Guanylate kinase n=1 Tax=Fulvitalea axinellae TaxID=1182444 RepID=A0AAU9CLX8_9BACT|nr:guanylate kinase [Fulvitalea axinellae]
MEKKEGKVIIFSAPSGSGKTTIVKHLLDTRNDLGFSISACTRDKRGRAEENGKDYYFLSPEDFKKRIDNDEFVEWEEVYQGNFYGTLKTEIQRIWDEGKHVIFDVDVKGGLNLKNYFGEKALAVFVKVPSVEELEKRLSARATDNEHSISQRVFKAKFEMGFEKKFDVSILNEDREKAFADAERIIGDFLA